MNPTGGRFAIATKNGIDSLHLRPGTTLRVVAKEGRIILEPLKERIVDRLYGKFKGEKFLEALEAEHRAEVEGESG